MEQSIASLSPEQAQRALMIFYDTLPAETWEGGAKPSAAKLESAAAKLQEAAPEDVRPAVDALLAGGSEEEKGEVAKAVLGTFYEQEELRGMVEQATEQARQPHMAPLPLIIGAVIVLLAALPKEVEVDGKQKTKKMKFGHLREVGALVKGFAEFAGKLPADVWKRLLELKG
jgi:hypothetical protein